jgi:hypothetical protein
MKTKGDIVTCVAWVDVKSTTHLTLGKNYEILAVDLNNRHYVVESDIGEITGFPVESFANKELLCKQFKYMSDAVRFVNDNAIDPKDLVTITSECHVVYWKYKQ